MPKDERERDQRRLGEEIAGFIGVLAIVLAFVLLIIMLHRAGWMPWRR